MKLEDLKKPFDPSFVSWRVGAMSKDKTKGIALAYIDARDVMERLDDVCGVENWQVKYSHANDKTIAEIGIKIDGEWVWKANGAGDTQVEAEKGAISDAMKRAAVVWGIGRYLYDVENIWVQLDEYKKIENPDDDRLLKALEKAAAGHRPKLDKKPKLNGESFASLQVEIKNAKTLEYFEKDIRPKIKSILNAHTCTKAQIDTLVKVRDKKLAELSQSPLPEAAE